MPSQQVTSTSAPWAPIQPYLQSGFSRAENLYQQGGPQYYPGQLVAGFGQDTTGALDMYRNRATQGSPVAGAANQQITGTLQGDYLGSNPYLDSMYDRAASGVTRNYQEAVAPTIGAKFGMSGRSGSGAYMNAMDSSRDQLGRSLEGMAANMYGNAYNQERGRQMQAASIAPKTAELGYYDASQLMNVGQQSDDLRQRQIEADFNKYNFNQMRPYENLGRYMGYLGGDYGSQNTQMDDSSTWGNIAGGALTGLSTLGWLKENGGLSGLLGGIF